MPRRNGIQSTQELPSHRLNPPHVPSKVYGWAMITRYGIIDDPPEVELLQTEIDFLSGNVLGKNEARGYNHLYFSNGRYLHRCPIPNCLDHHPTEPMQQYKRYGRLGIIFGDPFFKKFPPKEASVEEVKAWIAEVYEFKHHTTVFAQKRNVVAVRDKFDLNSAQIREILVRRYPSIALRRHLEGLGMTVNGADYLTGLIYRAFAETEGWGQLFNQMRNSIASIPGLGWLHVDV